MYHMYDLGWSHNKNYLMVDNVFLKSQQPILRKVQMEKHTLPTGPMDFLMGPNTLKYLFLKIIQRVFILDILTTYDSHLNKIAAS